MKSVLSRDQRVSILIWIVLACAYLTYKEIAAFYYPKSNIVFEYESTPIDSSATFQNEKNINEVGFTQTSLEINSADSMDFIRLKIPGYLISKILIYRKQLGGFVNSFQLLEIYHFPENIFERIHPTLRVNKELIQPLGINSKTEEELSLHPYLNYKEAKAVVLFRKNNGPIKTDDDFEKIIALSTETKEKLKPYLAKDFQSYANTPEPRP